MDRLNDLAEAWSAWLVHSGWQAAAVAGIAGLLLVLARRASAQFRYALLLVALAKFAAPPFLYMPAGLFSGARPAIRDEFRSEAAITADAGGGTGLPVSPMSPDVARDRSPKSHSRLAGQYPAAAQASPSPARPATAGDIHWLAIAVVSVHAVGVLLAGLSVGRRYRQVRRLVRDAKPAPADVMRPAAATAGHLGIKRLPAVLVSDETDAPFATGVLRPVILLPADVSRLPEDQLRVILGHELVHIRRYDLAVGWVETVLGVLWWFHPGMWWLRRRLRATREDCCDDVLLASRLTKPDRYCETLIQAAARQTFRPPEPVALGFAGGEHPAARRIRRLMDGSLFRTRRLRAAALLSAVVLGAVVLPGIQPLRAPVKETTLEGPFGWRSLPFGPDREELAIIEECGQVVNDYRSTYGSEGRTLRRFDDPETRDKLLALVDRRPGFFYPKHLLGTWYRRNGDAAKGSELLSEAMSEAPVVLTQRYRTGDGGPLAGVTIESLEIECNRVMDRSLDPSLKLRFVDLVTDAEGEVAVPVYDTVFRLYSRSFPEGYDTETARLGWFSAASRIADLPEVTAWKRFSRPSGFTRSAAESALLSDATGAEADELTLGPNVYRIARVARCQADGRFTERAAADTTGLAELPRPANAGYMDHAIIDLASPDPDRYEIGRVTILDSKTKIPLTSFQAGAGVKVVDKSRFHVYSLGERLPAEVDLVLTVKNFDAGALRMQIPVEPEGSYSQDGVTFVNEYLGAGQHAGWSSDEGFYKEAKSADFLSEMLYRVDAPAGRRHSLLVVTKDGERIDLEAISPLARIPRPLAEIDHFELVPNVPEETIYFEKLALPARSEAVSRDLPEVRFVLTGSPTTVRSDALAPVTLRCTTQEGDVYGGGFSGQVGGGFYEQEPGTRDAATKSTVIIEMPTLAGVGLSPEFVARPRGREIAEFGRHVRLRRMGVGHVEQAAGAVGRPDLGERPPGPTGSGELIRERGDVPVPAGPAADLRGY